MVIIRSYGYYILLKGAIMKRKKHHSIDFTGWEYDLSRMIKKGYVIDKNYPISISPVKEIRCKLILDEKDK